MKDQKRSSVGSHWWRQAILALAFAAFAMGSSGCIWIHSHHEHEHHYHDDDYPHHVDHD